jgi:hypothetical protein
MTAIEQTEDTTEMVGPPPRQEPYRCRFVETGIPDECTCGEDW